MDRHLDRRLEVAEVLRRQGWATWSVSWGTSVSADPAAGLLGRPWRRCGYA